MKKLKYVGVESYFLVQGTNLKPGDTIEVDDATARKLLNFKEGKKLVTDPETSEHKEVGDLKFIFEEAV
jgi:hypothetical protein